MTLLSRPNAQIAVVRFSALGDIVLAAAAVRALQLRLPAANITWITSPMAYALLQGMQGITFEVIDKPRKLADYRTFYRAFRNRRFDAVLALQANLRINLLYPALQAPIKLGFDRTRAREGQWLFCNRRIKFSDAHLLDSMLAFVETLTGQPAPPAQWDLPIAEKDLLWAQQQLDVMRKPWLAIHPASSKPERNWLTERYAEIIKRAVSEFGCSIVLTGGNTVAEQALCAQLARCAPEHTLNLCGKTTLKQLAALLGQVDALLAPDTGSVHIARAMNTPVVGLYAVASPLLTGPYQAMEYCVNRYPLAVQKFLGKQPEQLAWNTRVHHPGAMTLIEVDDVMQQLQKVLKR